MCGAIHGRERERSLSGRAQWHPALLLQGWSVQAALRLSCPRHGGQLLPPHQCRPVHAIRKGLPRVGPGRRTFSCCLPSPRPPASPAEQAQFRRGSRGLSWVWDVAGLDVPTPGQRLQGLRKTLQSRAHSGRPRGGQRAAGPALPGSPWTLARLSLLDSGSQKFGIDSGWRGTEGPSRV